MEELCPYKSLIALFREEIRDQMCKPELVDANEIVIGQQDRTFGQLSMTTILCMERRIVHPRGLVGFSSMPKDTLCYMFSYESNSGVL